MHGQQNKKKKKLAPCLEHGEGFPGFIKGARLFDPLSYSVLYHILFRGTSQLGFLRSVIPVVCLNYKVRQIQSKKKL